MKQRIFLFSSVGLVVLGAAVLSGVFVQSEEPAAKGGRPPSSYAPVVDQEEFKAVVERMSAAKPEIMKKQSDLLNERYDLSERPAMGVTMTRGKPVQEGVRVKLPSGVTWDQLAKMSPEEVRADPSEKLEAIEAIVPPHLRRGTFRPTDALLAWLTTPR